jgi:periplasmic divalent cation tolerance protein
MFSTAESEQQATHIAQELVIRKLAACVNIIPQIKSIYEWDGKIENSQEYLMLIKVSSKTCYRYSVYSLLSFK